MERQYCIPAVYNAGGVERMERRKLVFFCQQQIMLLSTQSSLFLLTKVHFNSLRNLLMTL
jgi:hypothetical protein